MYTNATRGLAIPPLAGEADGDPLAEADADGLAEGGEDADPPAAELPLLPPPHADNAPASIVTITNPRDHDLFNLFIRFLPDSLFCPPGFTEVNLTF